LLREKLRLTGALTLSGADMVIVIMQSAMNGQDPQSLAFWSC
jgi:hypothetical protein